MDKQTEVTHEFTEAQLKEHELKLGTIVQRCQHNVMLIQNKILKLELSNKPIPKDLYLELDKAMYKLNLSRGIYENFKKETSFDKENNDK